MFLTFLKNCIKIKAPFLSAFSSLRNLSMGLVQKNRYIWVDLELTGLDINKDTILEVACIVTTTHLKFVHEGINLIIHQPDNVLESMNTWSLEHHAKSGLTEASRKSTLSLTEAEKILVDYIQKHSDPEGTRYLAGNSVYMDKLFIGKHMPFFDSLLHYRVLDVSTLKVLFCHWNPDEFSKLPVKKITHRALDDILASIKELNDYRNAFFKK